MYKRDVYDIPMDVGYHTWAYGVVINTPVLMQRSASRPWRYM